jgi:hypothetical protein
VNPLHQQAACVAALVACSVAAAYLGGAPRPLKALTWACALVSCATLALALGAS